MLLYYITDRTQFSGSEPERRERLLARIAEAARAGVDFIQLREKDLCGRDLESLARAAMETIRDAGSTTRLLINSRTDIALAVGADGVHLRSHDICAEEVRKIWRKAGANHDATIAVSCHTQRDVIAAKRVDAQFVVFGPVFEKKEVNPSGIEQLHSACQHGIAVLALGGVTVENARECIQAGAAGVAGIRLFQEGELAGTVKQLKRLNKAGPARNDSSNLSAERAPLRPRRQHR